MDASQAIGIFDSGIGGLTVAHAVKSIMPHERIIYFGDTAHLPYGEKSAEAVQHFSERISQFLIAQRCKAIIIACNTASSLAYELIKQKFSSKVAVFNVIDPVARFVATGDAKTVGVIGTRATIQSGIYAEKIRNLNPNILVKSLATPLLAPVIEEGFFNNTISEAVIHEYLENDTLKDIDELILACTHYPLIEPQINAFYNGKTAIVNSADLVAQHVRNSLIDSKLLAENKSELKDHFYISDYTVSFNHAARMFFHQEINLEACPIWL